MIHSKETDVNSAEQLKALYKKWPDVKRYLKTYGCSSTDAEDLFQEALLIYIRKIEDPTFELTVAPFHYVKNTCKYLWYNQARKEGKKQKTEIHENIADIEDDDWFQKEMKLQRIEHAISKIGKQCQEILKLFYGKSWSMSEIAKKVGLRNDKVVKAQKYRCINKVKDQVNEEHNS
ncbi:MAG: sigma-70 family RNA polymerase sigma factor [Crocinitomicaceae bacterium]|nr:sigma-70 family RNA polymerase sigma factor [Crocinitomicaceae bacterium]